MKKTLFFSTIFALVLLFSFSHSALAADPTISGTVTWAADGTPVSGIIIYAESISDSNTYDYTVTGTNGAYTITTDPGSYVVYNYLYDGNRVYYIRSESSIVTVAADEALANVNLSLTRQPNINGYIYQSDGVTPINDVAIYTSNAASYLYGSAYVYSSYDGSYSVYPYNSSDSTMSSAGAYNIYYRKIGYFGSALYNIPLASEEVYDQDVSLTAFSRVIGAITDADNLPVANVIVSLTDGTYTYSSITNSSGQYTILIGDMYNYNGTAVGNYTLTAAKDNYVDNTRSVEVTADESTVSDQNLSLIQSGSISGTVKNSSQTKNLSQVDITAADGYGHTYTATTNANGTYSIADLNPSALYQITASKSGYLTENKYSQTVTAGANLETNFNLTKGSKFSGIIKNKSGEILEGATIYLYKRDSYYYNSANYSAESNGYGRFTINGIDPGNYRLMIEKGGYVTKQIRKIKLSGDKSGIVYQLAPASVIYGRATYKDDPVSGALIYAYGQKQNASEGYASATTDDQGYYQINDLKKGTYRVKILTTDYVNKTIKKILKKGQRRTINFQLALGGEISGYITDADTDLPLSNYCVYIKGTSRSSCTDSNGYYIINGLAQASYNLFVPSVPYQTAYQNNISVQKNETTSQINFKLKTK